MSRRWTEADGEAAKQRLQNSRTLRQVGAGQSAPQTKAKPCAKPVASESAKAALGKQPKNHEEDDLQISFQSWTESMEWKYPDLALGFHCPNGGTRVTRQDKDGRRYSPEAARLKRMGTKSGVPDWMLPTARGKYHGFAIEFKSRTGTMRPDQVKFCDHLERAGWQVHRPVRNIDTAIKLTLAYLTSSGS